MTTLSRGHLVPIIAGLSLKIVRTGYLHPMPFGQYYVLASQRFGRRTSP